MENFIRELDLKDLPYAAMVYARAFLEDPFWTCFFPDKIQREKNLKLFFRCIIRFEFHSGVLHGISDPIQGCALWKFPNKVKNQKISSFKIVLHKDVCNFLFHGCFSVFLKALGIFRQVNKMHKKYAPEPHYYLSILGVDPESQGKGYATSLIQFILEQADKEHKDTYLETMKEENLSFYKKFGFEVQEEWTVKNKPLKVWALLRKKSQNEYENKNVNLQ